MLHSGKLDIDLGSIGYAYGELFGEPSEGAGGGILQVGADYVIMMALEHDSGEERF